jgi:hypothetical protein
LNKKIQKGDLVMLADDEHIWKTVKGKLAIILRETNKQDIKDNVMIVNPRNRFRIYVQGPGVICTAIGIERISHVVSKR